MQPLPQSYPGNGPVRKRMRKAIPRVMVSFAVSVERHPASSRIRGERGHLQMRNAKGRWRTKRGKEADGIASKAGDEATRSRPRGRPDGARQGGERERGLLDPKLSLADRHFN